MDAGMRRAIARGPDAGVGGLAELVHHDAVVTVESGRTGEWPLIGFSSRKNAITLYLKLGSGNADELLPRLGKYTTGKGCLYLKRLSDVDTGVLAKIVAASVAAGASSSID